MVTPVVVCTGRGRGHWLADCLQSISEPDVTVAYSQTGGELGAIRMIWEQTRWSQWLMLQDSCVVLDQDLFRLVDKVGPCLIAPQPCMYLAVYDRRTLNEEPPPALPAGEDREVAIREEVGWMSRYVAAFEGVYGRPMQVLFPDLSDANGRGVETKHGRTNLVLANEYLEKWKGTWR
jgi:hypothetical protein